MYDDWLVSDGERQEVQHELTVEQEYRHYLGELAAVVRTPSGANVICTFLQRLGAFEFVWDSDNAHLARAAALNDFGQALLNDIAIAAEDVHDDIQRMMRVRRKIANILRDNTQGE